MLRHHGWQDLLWKCRGLVWIFDNGLWRELGGSLATSQLTHCYAIFQAHRFSISLGHILRAQYKPSAYSQLPSSVPVGYLAPIPILVVSDQILIIAVIIIPSQTEEASALRMGALSPFVQARHQCQPLTELFGNLDHHHCHHRCHHSLSLSMVPDTRRL